MNYKEQIEKQAARAWKANLSSLSEGAIGKLQSSGIFNRDKELSGLWKGTNNILRKNGAKNIKDVNKATSHVMQKSKEMSPQLLDDMDIYKSTKESVKNMGAFGLPDASHSKTNFKGMTHVSKHSGRDLNNLVENNLVPEYEAMGMNSNFSKIPRKDRESKKWADGILARHEADEIRYGNSVMNNPKKVFEQYGQKYPKTSIGGHISPKVLESESANVALSPKNSQNMFKSLRELGAEGGTEKEVLKRMGGSDYGTSAVYNKRNASRAEKGIMYLTNRRLNSGW